MKKAIIYWSGTGNTKIMAEAIEQGAISAGDEAILKSVDAASYEDVAWADILFLGCSSMGAEVLEEVEMEPFVEGLSDKVKDKAVYLFGSYGWGNGEWMADWEQRMKDYGARLMDDGLIINETPDAGGIEVCKEFGKKGR